MVSAKGSFHNKNIVDGSPGPAPLPPHPTPIHEEPASLINCFNVLEFFKWNTFDHDNILLPDFKVN